jgi:hypothetical protein
MDELERLLQADLPVEEFYTRYLTKDARDAIDASDFAGPDRSYPCDTQAHFDAAVHLLGKQSPAQQVSIKAKMLRIAKRKGFTLPKSWVEDKGGTRAMEPELVAAHMYVPISRIDKEKWEIEGQATSDVIDHYETIFDYDSSKRAFQTWKGNIREMHQNKAVGRALEWIPDDDNHRITLRARISRGAKDTWEKICDGTLTGFSIGIPAGKYKVKQVERNGKSVPMYYDHELAEVSVVDNPGSPGCDIAIVRADGLLTDVLDNAEEAPPESEQSDDLTRAGARISHITQDSLHGMRDGHLKNAQKTMSLCGCDECTGGMSALDPDSDGDIDLMPTSSLDWDSDGGKSDMTAVGMREIESVIVRSLAPTIQRANALFAQLAAQKQPAIQAIDTSAIERRLATIEGIVPGIAEVRSLLSEVKELTTRNHQLTEQIAAQPQTGGPFASGAAMDKMLATQAGAAPSMSNAEVIERARAMGLLTTQESQLAGASRQIAEMLNGRQ